MGRILLAVLAGILAAVPAAVTGSGVVDAPSGGRCARRIVSLAPHATQGLFALGAGGDVVGVDDYSREPAAALRLPKLGSYIDPDLEGIIGLRPDLVVLTPPQRTLAEQLGRLGLRTRIAPDTRLGDVFATLELLGSETCRAAAATELVHGLRRQIADAARADEAAVPPRAVLVVDRLAGDLRQFYVAGPDNFLDDVLRAAGAVNVFADAPNPFPQVSLEPIAGADPDLIIELLPGGDERAAAERVADWARTAPQLRAVRRGNVFAATEPWIPVPGTTVGRAVGILAALVAKARAVDEVSP
jgi:ABC-type Fe3+-hydroxamate transport system substrate-binding protein